MTTPEPDVPSPERLEDLQRTWSEMADEVRHHRDLYYNGQSVISDAEFDALFRRLQELEKEHPELAVPDSPTKAVSYTHLTLPTNREV